MCIVMSTIPRLRVTMTRNKFYFTSYLFMYYVVRGPATVVCLATCWLVLYTVLCVLDAASASRAVSLSSISMLPPEPMAECAVLASSCNSPEIRIAMPHVTIGKDTLEDDSLDLVEQLFPGKWWVLKCGPSADETYNIKVRIRQSTVGINQFQNASAWQVCKAVKFAKPAVY